MVITIEGSVSSWISTKAQQQEHRSDVARTCTTEHDGDPIGTDCADGTGIDPEMVVYGWQPTSQDDGRISRNYRYRQAQLVFRSFEGCCPVRRS